MPPAPLYRSPFSLSYSGVDYAVGRVSARCQILRCCFRTPCAKIYAAEDYAMPLIHAIDAAADAACRAAHFD